MRLNAQLLLDHRRRLVLVGSRRCRCTLVLRHGNYSLTGLGYLANGHHLLGPAVGGHGAVGCGAGIVCGARRTSGRSVLFGGDKSLVVMMRTYGISGDCGGRVQVDGV